MKKFRKAVALLMILVMALSLCGCSSFETKMLKGVKKLQELQSLHMDATVDIGMTMNVLQQDLDMDMLMNASSDIQTEPFKMNTEIDTNMMGVEGKVYSFIEKCGDEYCVYSSLDGDNWDKDSMDADDAPEDIEVLGMFAVLAKYASSFEKAGEEQVNDYNTVRYDGNITSDDIAGLIELAGGSAALSEVAGDEVDVDRILAALEGPFTIPASIWFDKETGIAIKYRVDVTEMMSGIMLEVMEEAMEEMGPELPDVGLEFTVNKTVVEVTLSQLDELGEITVPEIN